MVKLVNDLRYNRIMKNMFIVVTVLRDRWFWPKLTVTVEARVSSAAAGEAYIQKQVLRLYEQRSRCKFSRWSTMRVFDFRVVDEVGLKRLQAAAKASVTIRRKRAAKKAAATRAKNRAKIAERVARMNAARLRPVPVLFVDQSGSMDIGQLSVNPNSNPEYN